MNHWVICLPREDLEHCIAIGTIGLGREQTINKVKKGDSVACVVTKEKPWKIIAVGNAGTDYYVDNSPVFKKSGSFIDRFDLSAARLQPETNFFELIDRLDLITKTEYWSVYFKSGIAKLSDHDWQILSELVAAPV
ncbi:MAG: hypothetical protein ACRD3W_26035 [Terriglobales bacterium]